jgi:hypothetical protein
MNIIKRFVKDIYKDWLIYLIIMVNFFLILYILSEACPRINTKNIKLYNNIKNNLDTGDLILFSCDDFISKGIRYTLSSKYSHVGIVIKGYNNKLYILECDLTNSYDYITGKNPKKGAHLLDLSQKIEEYDGHKFAYRKLIGNKIPRNKIKKTLKKAILIKFQDNWMSWMSAHFKSSFFSEICNNPYFMFCSEYVANVYQDFDIFKKKTNPYFITPGDFEFDNLPLNENYCFGPIINFKSR